MESAGLLASVQISNLLRRGRARLSRQLAQITGKTLWLRPIDGVGTVKIRTNSTDDLTFRQVFVQKEYDISHLRQYQRISRMYQNILASGRLPIIIDAGANVGAASIWFSMQFPAARVLALEPDPGNASMCRANTEKFTNVKVVEAAIGSQPGLVSLSNPLNEAWTFQTIRGDRGHIV